MCGRPPNRLPSLPYKNNLSQTHNPFPPHSNLYIPSHKNPIFIIASHFITKNFPNIPLPSNPTTMATQSTLPFILLITLLPFLSIIQAQSTAQAPAPPGPPNITAILEKAGQYSTLIRLLQETAAGDQINNQANNSRDGMTVFAPTDNAFQNLPAGTLNQLSIQQQVQLIQYHILPKFYTFKNLQTVSNPVRTQASGQDGKVFGLNFTGEANNQNQVNVSSGLVNTTIFNALSQDFPLAVYSLDKVLLPADLFSNASAPAASPPAPSPKVSAGKAKPGEVPSSSTSSSGSERIVVGLLSLASGLWLISINLLS